MSATAQIQGLANNSVTIEKLLAMSAQNFADAMTQQQREKDHSKFIKEAESVQKSMVVELEERRRETMANKTEGWRSGLRSSEDVVLDQKTSEASVIESEDNLSMEGTKINPDADGEVLEPLNLKKARKFSAMVDAPTLLVSNKSSKTVKDELDAINQDRQEMELRENGNLRETTESKVKTPNLINLLKSSSTAQSSVEPAEPSIEYDDSFDQVHAPQTPVRLVCLDGSPHFSLFRPGGAAIECTAVIIDR